MKKMVLVLLLVAGIFLASSSAMAISLYVDAAPNVYGSADYAPWWSNAKSDVAAGTFANMRNGFNPGNVGTTDFEIQDEVVYSFGDLGNRLTWIYWIPNETISSLVSQNFQIRLENWWDSEYLDFYDYYYGNSWVTPTRWEEYAGGVIGSAGMAWWGASGVNTAEALAADILDWSQADETWKFSVRFGQENSSLTSNREGLAPVPEPTTILLFSAGLLGLGYIHRRRSIPA